MINNILNQPSRLKVLLVILSTTLLCLISNKSLEGWGKKKGEKKLKRITSERAAIIAQKHLAKARTLREKGKMELSIAEYKKSLEADPTSIEACLELADLYTYLQLHNKSAELLEAGIPIAVEQNISDEIIGKAYCNLALNRAALGQIDIASGLIAKAAAILPNNPLPHIIAGDVFKQLGRLSDSIRSFKQAIQLGHNDVETWWKLGETAVLIGDLPLCKEVMAKLNSLDSAKAAEFQLLMTSNSKLKAPYAELSKSNSTRTSTESNYENMTVTQEKGSIIASSPLNIEKTNKQVTDTNVSTSSTVDDDPYSIENLSQQTGN